MSVDVIIGLQRGDEGKGRFVDLAASDYDVVARGNGGANAGHTIVPDGMKPIALHQIPSGIAYKRRLNIVGNGVYLDPRKFRAELMQLQNLGIKISHDNLLVSSSAHLVMPHHIVLDELREGGSSAQGSTKAGIAYVASDKYLREGIRVETVFDAKELYKKAYDGLVHVNRQRKTSLTEIAAEARDWVAAVELLKPYVADTVEVINSRIKAGNKVLVEGAQAYGLYIDHGMYPYVTSSSTTVSGLLNGLGIAPKHVNKVIGVAKAVKSHVGGGPLVTEINDAALAANVRGPEGAVDSEFGATTKRPRRIGYLDIVELRNAITVNGVDELVLSKLDHVPRFGSTVMVATQYRFKGKLINAAPSSAGSLAQCEPVYVTLDTWPDISAVRSYAKLPSAAIKFIELIETELATAVTKIGVGPKRHQVIIR
jgi:adenylosuccinate synthase